ncbi:TPA_asm: maturation protein [ssRNA phage Esthiorhiza.2_37]|uniref:Maturation protein n=2 Tax=Fiersviridae TaxID=2842319 RepID=A0A8S5L3D5_9VIRU|nr:maturation protein [ssRNA phage Esthiorhiza.2_37]QDH87123.1 MAG: hypothetical protein H2RhizoLitter49668_000003 [Leviviridae sp.]DAD51887.1 TPA_asm: maturation protein [ssRNA phage Esthiorhiza.2_37]
MTTRPQRPNPETVNAGYVETNEIRQASGSYSVTNAVKSRLSYQRTWTGVRTPGFSKLKPSQYPVNPHTVTLTVVENDILFEGKYGIANPNIGFYNLLYSAWSNHYSAPAGPTHLSLARNKAIRNLIEKAELGIEGNIAQDFAQIGQTVRMVGDTAHRIHKSVQQLRHGNITGAVNTLFAGKHPRYHTNKRPTPAKSIADNWLCLQYGWKPLLQDINGAMKSLANLNSGSSPFIRRVVASGTHSTSSTTSYPPFDTQLTGVKGTHIVTQLTRCKMTLRYRIESPLKSFLAQTGFTNPLNLTWEIIPFSFVADWFLPIGPWLETLSAWHGLAFLDGSEVNFSRQQVVSAIDGAAPSNINNTLLVTTHGTFTRMIVKLDRSKLSSFPSQTFPSFKNGLASVDHALNGIALIKSVFHR